MSRLPTAQFSFNSGEFSPRLYGRTDVDKYKNALETATNCICLPHGPIVKRNGSKYIGKVKDSADNTRLIRFQRAVNDAYILEFGDQYIRFFENGDYVIRSSGTTTSTTTSKLVDSSADFVTDGVAVGDRIFNLTDNTNTTVTAVDNLTTLSVTDDIFASGEDYKITPELTTSYTESNVFDLEYAQFGDDLYISHSSYPTARLHRATSTVWTLENLDFSPGATFEDGEYPDTTVTPAATSGPGITFTAGAASFLANDVGRQIVYRDATTDELLGKGLIVTFTDTTHVDCDITFTFPSTSAITSGNWKIDLSPNTTLTPNNKTLGSTCTLTSVANTWKDDAQVTHVGRYVHIQNGIVRIDTVTSALVAEGEVVKALDSTTATDVWTLQEESWTSTHGYPRSIGFFEERLWLGGTTKQPQNIWGSQTNLFTNFGVGADDSDGLDLLVSDSIASPVQWISSGRDFIVGGSGGEFTVGSSGGFITPSDRSIRLRSTHGSGLQTPWRIDNETLFVDAAETRIRAIRYDFDSDNYIADDLLFFSDHLTKAERNSGIKEIAVAQSPNNLIYAILNNGDMIVGQFNRQQQVLGWERFQTKGDYKSVATITIGDHDEVWVIVERKINGSEVQYIERFDEFDTANGLSASDGFLDSFGTFGTQISVTSIAGSGSQLSSGTNTSVTASKLVDSGADFVTDGVAVGDVVTDIDNSRTTYVTAVDSLTTLSLAHDYFTGTGQNYNVIQAPVVTIPSGHGLVDDDQIIFYNALYIDDDGTTQDMDDINKKTFTVTNQQATTITLRGINGATWETYSSGGVIYKKVTAVTGLDHLEGETIKIKADNGAASDVTVSSGSVTLGVSAGLIQYGLSYTMTVKTLRLPDSSQVSVAGRQVRHINPVLRLYKSSLPMLNNQTEPIRDSSMLMNIAPSLFSGDAEYSRTDHQDLGQLTIVDSTPFPIMINGIFGMVEIGDL